MAYYSSYAYDCEYQDYIADMQMMAADDMPSEEELDEMWFDYQRHLNEDDTREDWVKPF